MSRGITFLNITAGLGGLVLSLSAIMSILAGPRLNRNETNGFLTAFVCMAFLSGCNFAGQLMRGLPGEWFRMALYISNFGEFLFTVLLAFTVSRMLIKKVDCGEEGEILSGLMDILLALQIALLITSQFTGLCYIIDENNMYQRTAGYPLTYIVPFVIMAMAIYVLINYRDQLSIKERRAFWVYYLVPLIAMYAQIFVYGIYFVNLALTIASVLMYILLIEDQRDKYYMQVETNETLKTDIMLSQIQPHFLYNALAVIREICLEDQNKAADAIDDFAKYLRHNMNSLSMNKPVPFEQELNHTKRYVELQRLRFGDELTITYDIQCSDFRIPSLTLQPIVENAVRYGARMKESGEGHVVVRTEEHKDHYELLVIDNGPGFDPDSIPDDDRGHIGLKNVESRLRRMTGGQLVIDSVIGQGTTIRMIIPKKQ